MPSLARLPTRKNPPISLEGPAPLWQAFVREWTKGKPVAKFEPPKGVVRAEIDAWSGGQRGPWTRESTSEWFITGTQPGAKGAIDEPGLLYTNSCGFWTVDPLKAELGRDPRPEEIAEEAGVTADKVELALSVADTVSLEQPIGEDGAQLGDFIEDEDAADPVQMTEEMDVANSLRVSIERLPEREGRILALRYGFYDGVPRTLEEIGDEFNLTRERIRQLEKLALCRLRHPSFGIREADLV